MELEVSIKKRFQKFKLNVSFETGGGVTGLLGASGCGKSMTLKCIAGLVTPDEGRIVLNGRTLFDSEKHIDLPPQKRRVGYLFQHYALFPNMTAAGNIAAGLRSGAGGPARVAALIRAFHLEGQEEKYPRQLSGGQQQRVALARILASEPEALLLDEPFSALDSYLKWQVELELSDRLAQFDGPVVFVTHAKEEVYRLCGGVCVLTHGRSEPMQSVRDLFDRPRTLSAALLSGCGNISRLGARCGTQAEALDWGVTLDTGRPVPPNATHLGIRAPFLSPACAANPMPCVVERVVEDLERRVVMLTPPGGSAASPLRMEADAACPGPPAPGQPLTVGVAPEHIMLLE